MIPPRGSLGKLLAGARGNHPLGAFVFAVAFQSDREGRCGEGTAPLRRVAEDRRAAVREDTSAPQKMRSHKLGIWFITRKGQVGTISPSPVTIVPQKKGRVFQGKERGNALIIEMYQSLLYINEAGRS